MEKMLVMPQHDIYGKKSSQRVAKDVDRKMRIPSSKLTISGYDILSPEKVSS